MGFSIPNSLTAKHQSKHLNRRLSSILLNSRHVNIVNEIDELLARRRDKSDRTMLSQVLKFALELNLSNRRGGLSSKSKIETGLSTIFDQLIDNAGFASSSGRCKEDRV